MQVQNDHMQDILNQPSQVVPDLDPPSLRCLILAMPQFAELFSQRPSLSPFNSSLHEVEITGVLPKARPEFPDNVKMDGWRSIRSVFLQAENASPSPSGVLLQPSQYSQSQILGPLCDFKRNLMASIHLLGKNPPTRNKGRGGLLWLYLWYNIGDTSRFSSYNKFGGPTLQSCQ